MGAELGGDPRRRVRQALAGLNFEGIEKEIYGQFENTFMMYLPRLCEHCLNPSCAPPALRAPSTSARKTGSS
jgi:nitrate reductase / nitrite oxidoreductase, beta subunit